MSHDRYLEWNIRYADKKIENHWYNLLITTITVGNWKFCLDFRPISSDHQNKILATRPHNEITKKYLQNECDEYHYSESSFWTS